MNDQPRGSGFSTLATHAGVKPAAGFASLDQSPSFLDLPPFAAIETPGTAPANAMLEERIAALEGGTAAVAVASGRTALLVAFHTLLQPGDEFVAARRLQDGTIRQFTYAFKNFGWRVRWADAERPESVVEALSDRTKAIFIESIAAPGGSVTDIEAIATIARRARVPLIVDNTLATPYLARPFEHGADIVVHSATAFLGGCGEGTGGLIVDGGTFEWMRDDGFPALSAPQPSYGDMVIGATFGNFAFAVACRALGLCGLGTALPATEAVAVLRGIETLALRMQRHCDTALEVAEHLARHPRVTWVRYAGLEKDVGHGLARRYCPRGTGAGFAFGLTGGHEASLALMKKLKLFSPLTRIGGTRSLVIHPASTGRRPLTDEQKIAGGAGPDIVQLSIGLEDAGDIIADLDQALAG